MKSLSDFLFNLYAKIIVLLAFLMIEIIVLIRNLKSSSSSSHTTNSSISMTQYLKLIEEKNPTICFTKRSSNSKQSKTEKVDCRVCLCELEEGEKVRSLRCKHTFHKDCLDQWLLQYHWATCPLCRNRVLPDDDVIKYRDQVDYDGNMDDYDDDHRDHVHHVVSLMFALHRYL